MFSPSGEKMLSFGKQGSGQGQFQHPRGVAVDGEGNILVVDSANNRIQIFIAEGHFTKTVGSNGSGPLQFFHPAGIMLNVYNNSVYVVDKGNCCVQILNSDLVILIRKARAGVISGNHLA